jgi:hypothetical protein
MGYSTWSTRDWTSYSATTATKSTAEIFTKSTIDTDLNPYKVLVRESRDSDFNPNSTPIIVGCDVTGSMGMIADHLVRKGIGTFFEELLNRKPITDPHMMVMGIGDAAYDSSPLQVSQFEADLTIAKWLEKLYIEHGGGGNRYESYDLPYYFAANHTSIDSWEKRFKKGYIFTIGDEEAPPKTFAKQVEKFIGDEMTQDMPFADTLAQAQKMYHCYHIIIAQGSHAHSYPDQVKSSWRAVMGQNAIWLEDYNNLSEVIVSTIQLNEGADKAEVLKSWSGATGMVVSRALDGVGTGEMTIHPTVTTGRGVKRI